MRWYEPTGSINDCRLKPTQQREQIAQWSASQTASFLNSNDAIDYTANVRDIKLSRITVTRT